MIDIVHILWDLHKTLLPWDKRIEDEFFERFVRIYSKASNLKGRKKDKKVKKRMGERSVSQFCYDEQRKLPLGALYGKPPVPVLDYSGLPQKLIDGIDFSKYFIRSKDGHYEPGPSPEALEHIADVRSLFSYLKTKDIHSSILTNDLKPRTIELIQLLGLSEDDFSLIITPDGIGFPKRYFSFHRKVFDQATIACYVKAATLIQEFEASNGRSNVRPNQILYVDDNRLYCLEPAAATGMQTLWLTDSEIYVPGPKFQYNSVRGLENLLRK
ncbi:HAD family hydrolase [Candidatus Woesearchaeota archaeon]|nr:HAD family hydrolase [Candidatus Woesearchaeota archaeon]